MKLQYAIPPIILTVIIFAIFFSTLPVRDTVGPLMIEYPRELAQEKQENLDRYLLDLSYIDSSLLALPSKMCFVEEMDENIVGESQDPLFAPTGMTDTNTDIITITLETYGADILLHELMHLVDEKVGEIQGEKPSSSNAFSLYVQEYGQALELTSYENSMPEEQFVGIMLRVVNTPGMVQEISPELYAWGQTILQQI